MGALLALLLAAGARAEFVGPPASGLHPADLAVIDEQGKPARLSELAAGEPALLLPIFTGCGGTCPRAAEALKKALAGRPESLRVIVLSFDPLDTPADLKEFRKHHALPASWRLARGQEAAATRAYLDELSFRVMEVPAGFTHPDAAFVLSPRGAWAGSFYGGSFTSGELDRARLAASAADAPPAWSRLLRPQSLIPICGGLLLLGLAAAAAFSR